MQSGVRPLGGLVNYVTKPAFVEAFTTATVASDRQVAPKYMSTAISRGSFGARLNVAVERMHTHLTAPTVIASLPAWRWPGSCLRRPRQCRHRISPQSDNHRYRDSACLIGDGDGVGDTLPTLSI